MLKKLVLTLFVLFWPASLVAEPIDKTQPYEMMKVVSEQAFERLKSEQDQVRENPDYLKQIVEEELMPYVNDKYAALKLLGPHAKKSKREDVIEFINAFHGYLITSYAQVLTQYSDQTIEFGPEPKLDPKKRITSIRVDIVDPARPSIKLEFKLRREKNGDWYAFDMIAEGVSLLSSKQSEWSGKLRQEGVLAVAKELETLAKNPVRFESEVQ
ncbi:MlaC/ttg2D family ABC transporter substrate-binding protein [Vibrio sonorensis]|uniref:MlaC/ttg2D family ABC transporter substrate-binding protein n=1 Tax=Vibrio sonorensis TaxID=1004316 RepID=UPI0008DB2DA7|nr:phospholipid-binding protein MlaC [Vibrio sonorensis]